MFEFEPVVEESKVEKKAKKKVKAKAVKKNAKKVAKSKRYDIKAYLVVDAEGKVKKSSKNIQKVTKKRSASKGGAYVITITV